MLAAPENKVRKLRACGICCEGKQIGDFPPAFAHLAMTDAAITVDTNLDPCGAHPAALGRSIFTQEAAIRAESTASVTGPTPASSPPPPPDRRIRHRSPLERMCARQRRRPFFEVLRDGQSHYCWPVRVLRSG